MNEFPVNDKRYLLYSDPSIFVACEEDTRIFKLWKLLSYATLFERSNFCPKIQFWQKPNIFTSFSPTFFGQFFSWNQSCQELKSPKPQHFHEFFTHKKNPQFSREIKVDFLDKKSRFRTVCMHTLWNISKLFKFISNFDDRIVSCYKTNTIERSIFWLVSWKWKWRVVQFFERGSCKFWADST